MSYRVIESVHITPTPEERQFCNCDGYEITGEQIEFEYDTGVRITLMVFKGDWTRYGSIRDCGDHYIHACHSRYDRIEKGSFEITYDVEDE